MDELQKSIYVDRFRVAFHTKKGTAFQDWFVRLAGYAFGPDFEEVRPYGPYGDLKCDGRLISKGSVFQCYAPDAMKEAELIKKIDEDFHGARAHWAGDMQEWVFVHNDGRGLPPNAVQHLDTLRKAYAPLQIKTWSEPELLKLTMSLNLSQLQALFGPAASISIVDRLVMADLMPIIDALQRQEPNPSDPPLTPPSAEKTWVSASPKPSVSATPSSKHSVSRPTPSSSICRTMPGSTANQSSKVRLWQFSPTSSTVATSLKIQPWPRRRYDPSDEACQI